MKRIALMSLLVAMTSCAAINTRYLGASYSSTDRLDMFFNMDDIQRPYEVMGYMDVAPNSANIFGASLEKLQKELEAKAMRRGADAIVFEGLHAGTPRMTRTEDVRTSDGDGATRTSTMTKDMGNTRKSLDTIYELKAALIKYKQ